MSQCDMNMKMVLILKAEMDVKLPISDKCVSTPERRRCSELIPHAAINPASLRCSTRTQLETSGRPELLVEK